MISTLASLALVLIPWTSNPFPSANGQELIRAAKAGALEDVQALLKADPRTIDVPDPNGYTALRWAGIRDEGAIAILLVEAGDVTLSRPAPIPLSRRILDEYVGQYDLEGSFSFQVWRIGDGMHLREFAPDRMVPVAVDTFVTVQEPWRVVFHRNDAGNVSSLEVDFLRRSVRAAKVVDPARGFQYVGTGRCLACHQDGPGDGPAGMWIASRHSRAFHTLRSDQSKGLAASREEYRDITDPSQAQRCLMCHTTAAQNPEAVFVQGHRRDEGVGCEAGHGPGLAYMTPEIMSNREAFLANGGRIPDKLTCRECHRDEAFDFSTRWERIRHGG